MFAMRDEHIFINQLANGMTTDQVFLVQDKELRTTRGGDYYISAKLADKSGAIPARMWQANETIFQSIHTEGFLHVKGRVEEYKGNLQLIIDACRPVAADKVNLDDYLAVTELDIEEMWAELLEILRAVKDKHLRMLIKKFVEDHALVAAFKNSPAAMQMHHAFLGGLLEHTLNVARAARALLPLYPQLNADLALVGIFLHDIGKCAELKAATAINYTERGMLVGHITIGAIWVQEKAAAVAQETGEPFPQATINLLQHLILSHHGEHQWGSPKLPAVPEAFFIHYLDNLDAKLWMTLHQIAADKDEDSDFTAYNRTLETRLYKKSGELQ